MRNTIVALVLGLALVTAGIAWAGDEVPAAKPAAEAKTAPTTVAKKADTATPSPIHTMMKWVGTHVMAGDDCACPSTAKGEAAWRAWFKADSPKLAGLRAAMVKDGWTADKTVGFFKAMAANKSCGSCDKDCDSCDKAEGAAADAGDAGKTGDASGGCCKSKGSCKDKKDCGGCDKKPDGAAADTGDAGKTGAASDKCPCTGKDKKDCGGCDKADCPCGK